MDDKTVVSAEELETIKHYKINVKLNNILDKLKELCIMEFMNKKTNGDELRGSLKVLADLHDIFDKKLNRSEHEA